MNKVYNTSVFLLCLLAIINVRAQLATPQILSSNMVLQQGCEVPVWGKATANELIIVSFADQTVKVKANAQGVWKAVLKPMKASFTAQQLVIKGKRTNIIYDNVVVGEVWLCSGQSNMEYRMQRPERFVGPAKGEDLGLAELKKPANPSIRVFNMERDSTKKSTWKVADSLSLINTSAAGYFFGKAIQEKLNVPVGIITSAIGGTRIEGWTSKAAYATSPDFAQQYTSANGKIDGYVPANWHRYMIAPLAPFALKGFLWYQGESNCGITDTHYDKKMKLLAESWRKEFNLPNSPFYYVLIGPHIYSDRLHRGSSNPVTAATLPEFWQLQIAAEKQIDNSGFVVISDLIDDIKDIHPSYKWIVGERLARLAFAKTYNFTETVWSGPRMKNAIAVNDSIVVNFEHCAKGLKTNDKRRLVWFEISNQAGAFFPALAEIKDNDKVVVWHPEIKNPKAVRFGWHETAMPNLVNSEGLPAVPFCVDINK